MTWEKVLLRDLGQWYGGGTPSKSNPEFWDNGTVPWLSPKDMGASVLTSTIDHITQGAVENSSTRLVPENSVAIVVRSGILERTLPVGLVPFATTLNQDMKAVVARPGIDPRWIAWGLRAFERELLRDTRKAGTTVASIEMPRFYRYALLVPALTEQRRIVEILEDHLSRLDAAADYASTAGRRIGSLRRSMLEQLFGVEGERVPLAQLVDHIEAGRSLGGAAAPADDGEWGIIKVSAMTWGTFRADENKAIPASQANPRYEIHQGDLLVSRANTSEYVGATVLVGEVRPRLLLSDKSLRLVPRADIDRTWLWRVLQTPSARAQISRLATGTKDSMRNISQKALLNVRVPMVDLSTQERSVRQYAAVDDHAGALEAEVGGLMTRAVGLRRAVLAAAFSGKLTGRYTDDEVIEELAEARA